MFPEIEQLTKVGEFSVEIAPPRLEAKLPKKEQLVINAEDLVKIAPPRLAEFPEKMQRVRIAGVADASTTAPPLLEATLLVKWHSVSVLACLSET